MCFQGAMAAVDADGLLDRLPAVPLAFDREANLTRADRAHLFQVGFGGGVGDGVVAVSLVVV